MDRRTVLAGDTLARGFTLAAKASGSPIVAGTVNHYLKALTGANAGQWWRDSDQTWQVAETANAMTHQADGHWTRALSASPWTAGVLYLEYAKESGDLHIPTGWMLVASYTPSADANRRVDAGLIEGGDATTALELAAALGAAAALTAYDTPNQTDLDATQAAILAAIADVPTVVEIDTQLSGSHGAGQWGAAGASGAFTRTFVVRDAATNALLPDALVTIRASNGTTILDQKRTDSVGEVVFSLDAGTYYRTVSALGYSTASAATFVVAGNASLTVALTALAVSPPSSAEFVTLYGDLYLDAAAQAAATITAEIAEEDLPALLGDYALNSGAERTATANASGRWELELQRGKRYRITAAAYGLRDYPVTMPTLVETVTLVSFLV